MRYKITKHNGCPLGKYGAENSTVLRCRPGTETPGVASPECIVCPKEQNLHITTKDIKCVYVSSMNINQVKVLRFVRNVDAEKFLQFAPELQRTCF